MPAILLSTLNARWSHCAFGLRCLRANLGDLRELSAIREFTIQDPPALIVERLLADSPSIIGLGIYIWNLRESTQVVRLLKTVAPAVKIIIGGPEVSFQTEQEPICALADVVITGEADTAFRSVCADLLAGRPVARLVNAGKVDCAAVVLPYDEYTTQDLTQRIVYVEASRGCPFTCEFCLSSISDGVRAFPRAEFLEAMADLIERGCRSFKFVDRTFNLSPTFATAILGFFLERWRDGMLLHFELVPDRLPDELKALLVRFPPGAVQFEIGIQSFTDAVGTLISRRMHRGKTEANLTWLRESTGIHLHTDLIIGLPGETLASFQQSFDDLWRLQPQEIQVGILKLLKGTPLVRHVPAFDLRFNPDPPYDLLASTAFPFPLLQRLKRFAKYFDLFVNHGHFPRCIAQLQEHSPTGSPFLALLAFADWLWATTGQDHALARTRQYELMLGYLAVLGVGEDVRLDAMAADAAAQPGTKGLPSQLHARMEQHRRSQRVPGAVPTSILGVTHPEAHPPGVVEAPAPP